MSRIVLVADFMGAVEAAARVTIESAGRQVSNLQVSIGTTSTASIDWREDSYGLTARIFMPSSLDPLGTMSQELADQWCAYWVHEIGHALFTDKAAWMAAVQEGISGTVNALEDVRMEGEIIRNGVATNAKGLLATLCNIKIAEARATSKGPLDFTRNFEGFLCYGGREALLGYDLGGLWAEGLATLPQAYQDLAKATLARLKLCKNTSDVNAMARWLRHAMQQLPKGQQGEGQPQEGQGEATEGQQGQGEGQQGQGEAETGEGPGEASQGQGEASQGEGEAPGNGGKGEGKGDGQPEQGKGDITDSKAGKGTGAGKGAGTPELTPELAPQATGTKAADGQTMTAHEKDIAASVIQQAKDVKNRVQTAHATQPNMSNTKGLPLTAKLDRDIATLIKAPAKTSRVHHRDHGRLSRRDTVRVMTGAKDVFALRNYVPAKNTATMILVDMSSSMSNGYNDYAEAGARMFTRAIERAGGLVSVAGFVEAMNGITLRTVKPFNKRAVACVSEGLKSTQGGTPMSPAMIAATRELLAQRTATKRLLIVLTDGQCNMGAGGTRFAARYAKAQGVDVIGIGIGCDPGKAFPVSLTATDPRALGEVGLGAILKALRTGDEVAA